MKIVLFEFTTKETAHMLPYGARNLADAFRTVRGNTIKAAQDIPDSHLDFTPAPGVRTVRQLLAHIAIADEIALTIHGQKMNSLAQLNFLEVIGRISSEEQKPRSKSELLGLLQERGDAFGTFLEGLNDDFLVEQVAMPPGAEPATKMRLEMLMGVKEHEMHHRGQLMLVQRMIGVVPHLTREREERFAAAGRR
jgi:uncharacterized damage-inducible protein DinB